MSETTGVRVELFEQLGVSQNRLAQEAGINAATLAKVLRGEDTQAGKERAVDRALVAIAHEKGIPVPDSLASTTPTPAPDVEPEEPLIEFEIGGQYGQSIIVRGPVSERAELERAAIRLIEAMNQSAE